MSTNTSTSLIVLAIRSLFAALHTTSEPGTLNARDLAVAAITYLVHSGAVLAQLTAAVRDSDRLSGGNALAAALIAGLANLAIDLLRRFAGGPK